MRTALRKALGTSGPAYRTLTTSGFEITDASRALGVEGDGLLNDGSFGIWEETENLCINGGVETNLVQWSDNGVGVVSRVTTEHKFGTASVKVTSSGVGENRTLVQWFSGSPITQVARTMNIWVKGEGATIGKTLSLNTNESGGVQSDASLGGIAPATVVLTAEWQRLQHTGTPTQADRVLLYSFLEVTAAGASEVYYADGFQGETGSVATPYVVTDGATATRNAARVQVPVAGLFTPTQGWMAVRLVMGWANTADPSGNPVVFDWRDDANNLLQLRFDTTGNTWELQRRNTGGTGEVALADTFALNEAVTVIAAWDALNLKVSVNGGAFTSAAATNIPTLAATMLDIGSIAGTSEHLNGDVLWFACGTGTLTDADAATINGYGNNDVGLHAFPGNPTGFWDAKTGVMEVAQ